MFHSCNDSNAIENGRFYIHSDHLGSTSTLSDENGAQVGTTTRYTPFGDYRTGGQSDITDRGFTGHKENRGIGLTYMNARYYLPSTGRFLSADTIVPDPTNPQSFNRYTYVMNSPLRYTDPTGHLSEDEINDYFGYDPANGNTKDAMIADGWNSEVVNLLHSEDFTWSDAFSFDNGGEQTEAMLVLIEAVVGSGTYRGALWGMSGSLMGREIYKSDLNGANIDRYTDEASAVMDQFDHAFAYSSFPIAENLSFMKANGYVEVGMAGVGRWATYAGGGALIVSAVGLVSTSTGGTGLPPSVAWGTGAMGVVSTGVGFLTQAMVDTGHAEHNKQYFIITYLEPLGNQWDWGIAKPGSGFSQ